MLDPLWIGVICTALGLLLGVGGRSWSLSGYIAGIKASAEAAKVDADEAKKLSEEAHTRITILAADFGMYRERVAMTYASNESVNALKGDLMSAINKIGDKLDQVLSYERSK